MRAIKGWRLYAAIATILLSPACATTRYLTRSCITQDQFNKLKAEAPPKVRDQLTGDAQKDVRILAGNLIRRHAYEDLLIETLRVCASPSVGP